jgi:hypothetical protein
VGFIRARGTGPSPFSVCFDTMGGGAMKRFRACTVFLTFPVFAGCASDGRSAPNASAGSGGATEGGASSAGGSGAGGANGGGAGLSSGGAANGGTSTGGAASAGSGGSPAGSGGGKGIASGYPGDAGIEAHPAVIFADDFEAYQQASELGEKWDNFYQVARTRISTEPANVFGGSRALEFTVPEQDQELSNAVDKLVSPELDVLYLRYYSKFQPPYDVVGSSHNGSSISAHYFNGNQATPGIPADGTNKFLVNLENWRGEAATPSPGLLNVYVYHPEQRSDYGDHFFPSGLVMPNTSLAFDFGADFVERPELVPELDRWYCYEYMVRANTPNQRDGRISVWLDGELVADFPNLRFRDVGNLRIDRFQLSFHIGTNPNGETKKWFDNVVAATAYIGPMRAP